MYPIGIAAQLCGLVGVLLLAIPAFHAARYGALLAKLQNASDSRDLAPKAYDEAAAALARQRDSWKPWKSCCLRIGTVLAVLSYGLALWAAVAAP